MAADFERRLAITGGPKEILGTKCPSMTSRWMSCAPAFDASCSWFSRLAKSAARIEGDTSVCSEGNEVSFIVGLAWIGG